MSQNAPFRFESKVRDYELDAQGIVNNAVYMNYFEHARHEYIKSLGINFVEMHHQGYDLVMVATEMKYKKPLSYNDAFYVTVEMYQMSPLKVGFKQAIYLQSDEALICQSLVTTTCIDPKTKRPKRCPIISDILASL